MQIVLYQFLKTYTYLSHKTLLHSISRKIGFTIQIVVHKFVSKTSTKKNPHVWNKLVPLIPRYAGMHRIITKEYRVHVKHMEKISIQVGSHNVRLVDPFQTDLAGPKKNVTSPFIIQPILTKLKINWNLLVCLHKGWQNSPKQDVKLFRSATESGCL
jgi:hypothetical protein